MPSSRRRWTGSTTISVCKSTADEHTYTQMQLRARRSAYLDLIRVYPRSSAVSFEGPTAIGGDLMLLKRSFAFLAALVLIAGGAHAQISDGVIKIGVMNDQSGTYADLAGPGSVVAARMAAEDFGAAKKGMKVEILVADHQNKPEVGSGIARQGFDVDQVDEVVDV